MAGPLSMIMNFKWNSDCFFWRIEIFRNWYSAACFFTKRKQSKQASWWWFAKVSMRLPVDGSQRFKEVFMNIWWLVFSLSESKANRSNWWFMKISKRFLINVQWLVLSLNKNRANRSNDDDIWKLLKPPFCDFFEKLKFFEIDVPRPVFPLSENKTNRPNDDDV